MFISHKYKFIFLRTPKTASSSLSEFFIKNIPDSNAIYTPVEDSNLIGTLDKNIISKYDMFRYCHFTIEDLIKENIITEKQARSYRSFAVIRDPIDRQKSFYYFYRKWKSKNKIASIEEYKLLAPDGTFVGEPNSIIKQSDFLRLDGEIIGNYWLYQNLNFELNKFMIELGLDAKFPLKNHKSNFRKNRNNEIVFDEDTLANLKKAFKSDFDFYESLTNNTKREL